MQGNESLAFGGPSLSKNLEPKICLWQMNRTVKKFSFIMPEKRYTKAILHPPISKILLAFNICLGDMSCSVLREFWHKNVCLAKVQINWFQSHATQYKCLYIGSDYNLFHNVQA